MNETSDKRLALMIDLERCIGCKSCEAACKSEHGLGPGEYRNRVTWLGDPDGGAFDFLTVTCQHCERPACLRACPVNPKAIEKDPETGVVRVIESRCTGCGECVVACPYGAMGFDAVDHHSVKCDLCHDRRQNDQKPACATVCPGSAISFGERTEHVAYAERENRTIRDHDHFLLEPATIYLDALPRENRINDLRPVDKANARRPKFMDNPAAQATLREKKAEYPYRTSRAEREVDSVRPGGCNICFNCCSTNFHFKGDKLVRVTGNEEDPLLKGKVCPKSQMTVQMYNNDERLMHPLKRVGARGEGKFERISWDQALDEIAEKLKSVRDEVGSEALAMFIGTRTGIITKSGYVRMFAQMYGTPNVESTDAFCATSKAIAYQLTHGTIGAGNSYTETDLGAAELYVYIGDNQAETRPVYFGMINDWRIKNGAKMVAIDPRLTPTASKADRWFGIRPGTDMALALALAYSILERNLHDEAFCEEWIVGWEIWRDYILDNAYTPEWAAPITDISAEDIRWLAEQIATADGCVMFGSRGINQHTNSTQTNRVLMYVCAITGNWGRKGGTYLNMSAGPPVGPNVPESRMAPISRPKIRKSPSGWTEAMRSGSPYPIKAMIACNNPFSQWPDQNAIREAFESLELLVHIELFANATSAFADYVLPAAAGIEKGEIGRANDDRRIVWIDRMIDPPGDAKPDAWIWVELGKRLGFDDVLQEKYKDTALFWDEVCIKGNPHLQGITQKRLHSRPYRWVRFPVASEDAPEIETLYLEGTTAVGQPEGKRFATPSGKLEFYTEAIETKFNALGMSSLPEFYSEREQRIDLPYVELQHDDSEAGVPNPFHGNNTSGSMGRLVRAGNNTPGQQLRAKGFELELVTGRASAAHFHSWTHYFWQAQEMWPDMYCQLHPNRAAEIGVEDGQKVRVSTAHGSVEAVVWITNGIREHSVFLPIGWDERQPYHPWKSVNYLTDKMQREPMSDQTNLKMLLCKVEKIGS
ncbi:MAG: molybdopterin-dependent oxidoreductase [Rhodospirillales bacterium]|nr:molybdopterin-dependent oxidoreductase [Rhodospirillales bacterium]